MSLQEIHGRGFVSVKPMPVSWRRHSAGDEGLNIPVDSLEVGKLIGQAWGLVRPPERRCMQAALQRDSR